MKRVEPYLRVSVEPELALPLLKATEITVRRPGGSVRVLHCRASWLQVAEIARKHFGSA